MNWAVQPVSPASATCSNDFAATPYTFWLAVAPFLMVEQDASVTAADLEGLEQVYREHSARLWRALVAYTADREIGG